jgi:hypothetical protein
VVYFDIFAENCDFAAVAFVARLRKAILSFRLRLHSGLRQEGGVFDAAG